MAGAASLRTWSAIHKWSSLACTVFLLMLCVTGLPLIFHQEVAHLLDTVVEAPAVPAGTPRASLDRVLAAAQAQHPAKVAQFVAAGDAGSGLWYVTFGDAPRDTAAQVTVFVAAHTAQVLEQPRPGLDLMDVVRTLHTDLYAGLPGSLLLGCMGLLLLLAVVSGVVLYAPFMRKLRFGTVRANHAPRTRWLDLHNLLGIVTLVWLAAVGATGVVNTLAEPLVALWRVDQLAEMIGPDDGKVPAGPRASLQASVDAARVLQPGMTPRLIALPGTAYTSARHFGIFLRGDTPLTARLLAPVLVDATTGVPAASRALPWYIQAMLLSQPLHFGDYGGLPLKVLWALLDVAAIVVLASGVVLWLRRRDRPPAEASTSAPRRDIAAAPAARPVGSLWAWPVALGAASVVGLAAALLGNGWWDALSAAALALPLLVTFACLARMRRPVRAATDDPRRE